MDKIIDSIQEWFLNILRDFCISNISGMFDSVNVKVETISTELGKNPQTWNGNIFNMIKSISDNAVLPIAGMILAAILTYEFISLIVEKNNMHEVPIESFAAIFLKMGISIYVLSHTFDFVMGIFDITQKLVSKAGGLSTNGGSLELSDDVITMINEMTSIGELISITLLAGVLRFVMYGISMLITIVLYGRMMQIYMYLSVAPIPFATFANREWGTTGTNYVRAIAALGLQAFLMLICTAVYSALVQSINATDDIVGTLLMMVAYTVLLVLMLFKTHTVAQSITNAH